MVDPIRQEVLRLLNELSDVAPEVPLGQLMANLATLACGVSGEAIWEVQDTELLEAAREHLEQYRVTHANHANHVLPPKP